MTIKIVMQIIKSPRSMQKLVDNLRRKGKQIGLVPTMGAFHGGHLSLIRKSVKENDVTVVSIFVNPTQFGPHDDFSKYPRTFKADCNSAKKIGVDIIFHPSINAMYPDGFQTFIIPGKIADKLEGAARPGHMRGVATVCVKLFNIVKPHRAYFGQKDAQQLAMIKRVTVDLNLDLKIIACPIVRTASGIALSSRHSYLSEDDLNKAEVVYESLKLARSLVRSGVTDIKTIRNRMVRMIKSVPKTEVEYIAFNRWDDLKELDRISGKILISLAVVIDKVRLLDNIIINSGK
jgi:pantoate--beta-alanine ligase